MKNVITHYRLENLRIASNCHDEANISEPTLRKRIYKYARTELPARKSIIEQVHRLENAADGLTFTEKNGIIQKNPCLNGTNRKALTRDRRSTIHGNS